MNLGMTVQEYLRRADRVQRAMRGEVSDDEVIRAIKSVPPHYAANFVATNSQDATTRGRSNSVWAKCKFNQYSEWNDNGGILWEEFLSFGGVAGATGGTPVTLSSTLSPASVGSSTAASQTFAFAGTLTSDVPIAIQKPTFQAGLALDESILIGAANSLSLNFINPTAGAISPTGSQTYVLTVLRKNGLYSAGGSGAWRSQEGGTTPGSISTLSSDSPTGPSSVATALGTIRMNTGAVAHQSVALEAAGGQFGIGGSAAATAPLAAVLPRLFFEARVRLNQSTVQSAFIGMAAQGQAATVNTLFNSSDVWQNTSAIGFRINGATSTTAINAVYATGTGTTSVTSTATVPSTITNWTKLGFLVDPYDPTNFLQFYQDGVLVASVAAPSNLTAANWPSAVALTPVFYLQAQGAGAAAVTMDIDWVGVGQTLQID